MAAKRGRSMAMIETMSHDDFESKCWHYYLMLERDLLDAEKYVAFSEKNDSVFSLHFARQLISVCMEIESLCKLFTKNDANDKSGNIIIYFSEILKIYPDLNKWDAKMLYTHREFKPFANLDLTANNPTLPWWKCYTKIKHYRIEHEEDGSLLNVLNAMAALYLLMIEGLKKTANNCKKSFCIDAPLESSHLFEDKKLEYLSLKNIYFVKDHN